MGTSCTYKQKGNVLLPCSIKGGTVLCWNRNGNSAKVITLMLKEYAAWGGGVISGQILDPFRSLFSQVSPPPLSLPSFNT